MKYIKMEGLVVLGFDKHLLHLEAHPERLHIPSLFGCNPVEAVGVFGTKATILEKSLAYLR